MKLNIKDKVRVKTREELLADPMVNEVHGDMHHRESTFYMPREMLVFCNQMLTVKDRRKDGYRMFEGKPSWTWERWMLTDPVNIVNDKVFDILRGKSCVQVEMQK